MFMNKNTDSRNRNYFNHANNGSNSVNNVDNTENLFFVEISMKINPRNRKSKKLLPKVFTEVHNQLAKQLNDNGYRYGISFPRYNRRKVSFGNMIRIFSADKEALKTLNIEHYLKHYGRLVYVSGIMSVPHKVRGFSFYKRFQTENSLEAKTRRYIRRHKDADYDTVLKDMKRKTPPRDIPCMHLKSTSTEQMYTMFINRCFIKHYNNDEGIEKNIDFNTFGLSKTIPVPEF